MNLRRDGADTHVLESGRGCAFGEPCLTLRHHRAGLCFTEVAKRGATSWGPCGAVGHDGWVHAGKPGITRVDVRARIALATHRPRGVWSTQVCLPNRVAPGTFFAAVLLERVAWAETDRERAAIGDRAGSCRIRALRGLWPALAQRNALPGIGLAVDIEAHQANVAGIDPRHTVSINGAGVSELVGSLVDCAATRSVPVVSAVVCPRHTAQTVRAVLGIGVAFASALVGRDGLARVLPARA